MPTKAMYEDLKGKVSLVTGGSTGIGKAAAIALAQSGAIVVIADVDELTGCQVVSDLKAEGSEALFIKTDVSESTQVKGTIEHIVSTFGRLDIAVNNAAVPPDTSPIADLDENQWRRVIDVNLTGVAFCLKWELRQMQTQHKNGGGKIINLASATSIKPEPNLPAYTTAKHGVVGLTRVAAIENGGYGIRVNALAPGAVSTELTARTLASIGSSEEEQGPKVGLFGRFARPSEIAEAITWLASDVSAYVTGSVLVMDSGLTII
ncbi:hypothetical protein N7509_000265 [Penicillium cosmopolitanum]|uniref:Uncharacterized protein n=1 Tax=Penicillium cosmopolitanum TaxID=1131564 RepID=A0A9W9WA84_9EURO|nr:uncharacterized protein N7509_000265 [Penicillium cosmopolitanum]KAJ5413638.1 hypothetical protein N7509_000265 [Penicillium cosmopolitanum]